MTRDADNDNSAAAARRSLDQTQSWQGLSHGNAALADRLAADISADASGEFNSSDSSEPAVGVPAAEALPGSEMDDPISTDLEHHDVPIDWGVARDIPSSDAVPIELLGIATPHRPIPAAKQTQIEPRPPRPRTRRHAHVSDLGRQETAHLFNTPPNAPQGRPAEQSPMEQAINVKPRPPLTSQPGFLAGLVAALVCGGGYYSYLMF